jgi:hypothetical protein
MVSGKPACEKRKLIVKERILFFLIGTDRAPKHDEKTHCQRIKALKGVDADIAICKTIPVTFEYWREVTKILEMDMPKRNDRP